LALLGLAPFCIAVPHARADYEETERRLKACGTDDALRKQIHDAIDRGVKFLVSRQQADGSFVEPAGYPASGVTLLCALALRHAGTPEAMTSLKGGLAYLFASDPPLPGEIEKDVYQAGIALMLLAHVPGYDAFARRFATALSGALDGDSDWWGYRTPGGDEVDPGAASPVFRDSTPNMSTSQFAALGLWAARRMGIAVPPTVWIRHATALCASQKKNGSWQYQRGGWTPRRKPGEVNLDDEFGVVTGTYMGLANLLLAQEALRAAPGVPDGVKSRVSTAIASARKALARHVPRSLTDPRASIHPEEEEPGRSSRSRLPVRHYPAKPGIGAYYTLFALEKACLFADIEAFDASRSAPLPPNRKPTPAAKGSGKVSWYATGAQWLLSVQRSDGGWSPNAGDPPGDDASEVDTALALLFLLRSPSVYHPTKPTEVDAKSVTPSEPTAPPMGK
jgi:hypothetical protein